MSYCFPIEGLRYCGMLLFYRYFHMQVSHSPEGALAEHRIIPLAHTTAYHRATEEHQRLAALPRGDIAAAQLVVATAGWGGKRKRGQIEKLTLRSSTPSPTSGPQRGYPCPGAAGRGPGALRAGRCSGQVRGVPGECPGSSGDRGRAKPGLRSAGSCLPAGRAALRQLPAGEDSEKGKEIKGREPRTTPPREAREGRAGAARPADGAG